MVLATKANQSPHSPLYYVVQQPTSKAILKVPSCRTMMLSLLDLMSS